MLQRENDMLEKLVDHPNIISPLGLKFDGEATMNGVTEKIMYNVLEYAHNGAISRFVRYTGGLEEEIARFFILQIWDAIQYIHHQDYAHLDIKLENILLDEYFNIKVADLGSCISVEGNDGMIKNRRGTALYMAPEVSSLKSKEKFNGKAADIYSLGVTIYLLLTGEFPNMQEMENSVNTWATDPSDSSDCEMSEDVKGKPDKYSKLSDPVKQLLQSMLNSDPAQRPTIDEIWCFDWLCYPVCPALINEAFQEMSYRKKYILSYCKSGQGATPKHIIP